jgi:voltage-gated potassium channel Kch
LLLAQRVPFVAIEHSPEQVDFVRRFGNQIYYGDPARLDLLRAAGAGGVRVFVVAIEDVEANLKAVRLIRREFPRAKLLARARNRRHAWQLMDLGVEVVRETFFSSLYLGERVLVALGTPEAIAADRAARFRAHDETLLRTQHLIYDDEAALIQTSQEARKDLEQLFAADQGEGVLGGLVERGAEP